MSRWGKHKAKVTRWIIPTLVIVLLIGGLLFWLPAGYALPDKVWLPDNTVERTDNDTKYGLPTKSEVVWTKYGRAIKFTPVKPMYTIYQFRANPLLSPLDCPNITNIEDFLPSSCTSLGKFQGRAVYSVTPSLPSGLVEYYVTIDNTFVYIKYNGDAFQSLDYLQSFKELSRSQSDGYLEVNEAQVNALE